MASPGISIIAGKYISAWGGVQSAGQTIGQIVRPLVFQSWSGDWPTTHQLLQYATEKFGRKIAFYIIWLDIVISVFIESFATRWDHWLAAKLFSGMGVGMLQSTLPLYLSEIAPTQLRGFYINAYSLWVRSMATMGVCLILSSWFVVGQIFASVALQELSAQDPYEFRVPIYTQVRGVPHGQNGH